MKFDWKLLNQHMKESAEMIDRIKADINAIEDGPKKEELISEICIVEKYNNSLQRCVSVYSKCEKEIYR